MFHDFRTCSHDFSLETSNELGPLPRLLSDLAWQFGVALGPQGSLFHLRSFHGDLSSGAERKEWGNDLYIYIYYLLILIPATHIPSQQWVLRSSEKKLLKLHQLSPQNPRPRRDARVFCFITRHSAPSPDQRSKPPPRCEIRLLLLGPRPWRPRRGVAVMIQWFFGWSAKCHFVEIILSIYSMVFGWICRMVSQNNGRKFHPVIQDETTFDTLSSITTSHMIVVIIISIVSRY